MASGAPVAPPYDSDSEDEIAQLNEQIAQMQAELAAKKAAKAAKEAARAGKGAAQVGTAGEQGGGALAEQVAHPAGYAETPLPQQISPGLAALVEHTVERTVQKGASQMAEQVAHILAAQGTTASLQSAGGRGLSGAGWATACTGGSMAQQHTSAGGNAQDEGQLPEIPEIYTQTLPLPAEEPLVPVETPHKDLHTAAKGPFCRHLGVQVRCEKSAKGHVVVKCSKGGCPFGGKMTLHAEPVPMGKKSFCCDHNHPVCISKKSMVAEKQLIIKNCSTYPFNVRPDLLQDAYTLILDGGGSVTAAKIQGMCLRDAECAEVFKQFTEDDRNKWKKQISNFVGHVRREILKHKAKACGGAASDWLKPNLTPEIIHAAGSKEAAEVRWPGGAEIVSSTLC